MNPHLRHVLGDDGEDEKVTIKRAENGYIVTMYPSDEIPMIPDHVHDEEEAEEVKEIREKTRPRVFVYEDIDKAMETVKEFLLDGRIPKKGRP